MSAWILGLAIVIGLVGAGRPGAADDTAAPAPSPDGARVYFIAPADGAVVGSPLLVQFGVSGMGVAPAGVERENTGHFHLLIDRDLPPLDEYLPPTDETLRHYGGGQTEALVELPPGRHTLQVLFADADHLPHDPPVYSDKITITVK